MGKSELVTHVASEAALVALAAAVAAAWRNAGIANAVIGLRGDLGAGKTTWVRAMLNGLGFDGRVPSPTYTLIEPYALDGLTVVHMDLYRLTSDAEFEQLGVRDWLAQPGHWVLAEWPERVPAFAAVADLSIDFSLGSGEQRQLVWRSLTDTGRALVTVVSKICSK